MEASIHECVKLLNEMIELSKDDHTASVTSEKEEDILFEQDNKNETEREKASMSFLSTLSEIEGYCQSSPLQIHDAVIHTNLLPLLVNFMTIESNSAHTQQLENQLTKTINLLVQIDINFYQSFLLQKNVLDLLCKNSINSSCSAFFRLLVITVYHYEEDGYYLDSYVNDVVEYITAHECISTIVSNLKSSLASETFQLISILISFFKLASLIPFGGTLLDEFIKVDGYSVITQTIFSVITIEAKHLLNKENVYSSPSHHFQNKSSSMIISSSQAVSPLGFKRHEMTEGGEEIKEYITYLSSILDEVKDLIFINDNLNATPREAGSPKDPNRIVSSPRKEDDSVHLVCNLNAFRVFCTIFNNLANYITEKELRAPIQSLILDRIMAILDANRNNYKILQPLHFLTLFLDLLDSLMPSVKNKLLQILHFVALELNIVPFQELSTLSCLLQIQLADETVIGIYKTAKLLIESDIKFKGILQQTGLLDMTIILLQIKSKSIADLAKDTNSSIIISPKNSRKNSRNGVILNENTYPSVIECLSIMMIDSFENVVVLREAGGLEVLFILVADISTQVGALDLLEVVVKETASYSRYANNPTRKEIGDSVLRGILTGIVNLLEGSNKETLTTTLVVGDKIVTPNTAPNVSSLRVDVGILCALQMWMALPSFGESLQNYFLDVGGFKIIMLFLNRLANLPQEERIRDPSSPIPSLTKKRGTSILLKGENVPSPLRRVRTESLTSVSVPDLSLSEIALVSCVRVLISAVSGNRRSRRYLRHVVGYEALSLALRAAILTGTKSLIYALLDALFSLAMEDTKNIDRPITTDSPSVRMSNVNKNQNGNKFIQSEVYVEDFLYNAEAIILLLEIISSAKQPLKLESVTNIIQRVADIALHPVNRRSLASCGVAGAILKFFGVKDNVNATGGGDITNDGGDAIDTANNTPPSSINNIASNVKYSSSLILPSHPLQPLLIRLLVSIATYKLTPGELRIWEDLLFINQENGISESMLRALVGVSCGNDGVAGSYSLFPYITFECSSTISRGFSCLKIPSLLSASCPSWPPSNGYSFAAWIRIDHFDNSSFEAKYAACIAANTCMLCETKMTSSPVRYPGCTHEFCNECLNARKKSAGFCPVCNPPTFHLLHVMNSSDGKTSLLIYSLNNNLYVATSPKHAIMFEKLYLTENRWLHIGITHSVAKRSAFSGPGTSQINLYLNGLLVESQKLAYPVIASRDASAYIGTSESLSCKSRFSWRIGPCYLLQDCISNIAMNALFCAGPKYDGGFFGEDGSGTVIMTHELLSAENIALLQPLISSSNSWGSSISILQNIALPITPELVIFNFSARRISATSSIDEDPVVAAASRKSGTNVAGDGLEYLSNGGLCTQPVALLVGGTQAFTPQRIGLTAGNIAGGGIPFILRVIGNATTRSSLQLALTLLRSLLHHNTPFLSAMIQQHAYEAIAYLLCKSSAMLDERSLRFIFTIVGLGDELNGKPSAHVTGVGDIVTNVEAANSILFCWDIWKNTTVNAQKKYFEVLLHSLNYDGASSAFHSINRTLYRRLKLVRYLLNLFTCEDFLDEIVPFVISLLKNLISKDVESEELAAISLFLTSTLSSQFGKSSSTHRLSGSKLDGVKLKQRMRFIRNSLFEMLINVMPDLDSNTLSLMAKNFPSRWFLYFSSSGVHTSTVLLALRLLNKLYPHLISHSKRKVLHVDIFNVIGNTIPNPNLHGDSFVVELYHILFCMLLSVPSLKPFDSRFNLSNLEEEFAGSIVKLNIPQTLHVIFLLLKRSCENIVVGTKHTLKKSSSGRIIRRTSGGSTTGLPEGSLHLTPSAWSTQENIASPMTPIVFDSTALSSSANSSRNTTNFQIQNEETSFDVTIIVMNFLTNLMNAMEDFQNFFLENIDTLLKEVTDVLISHAYMILPSNANKSNEEYRRSVSSSKDGISLNSDDEGKSVEGEKTNELDELLKNTNNNTEYMSSAEIFSTPVCQSILKLLATIFIVLIQKNAKGAEILESYLSEPPSSSPLLDSSYHIRWHCILIEQIMEMLNTTISSVLMTDKKVQNNITKFCTIVMSNVYMLHWVPYGPLTAPPILASEEMYLYSGASSLLKLVIHIISLMPHKITDNRRATVTLVAVMNRTTGYNTHLTTLHTTLHECILHLLCKQTNDLDSVITLLDTLISNAVHVFPPISSSIDKTFLSSLMSFIIRYLFSDNSVVRIKSCELLKNVYNQKLSALEPVIQVKVPSGEIVDLSRGFNMLNDTTKSTAPFSSFQTWLAGLDDYYVKLFREEWSKLWAEVELNNVENTKKIWITTHKFWSEKAALNKKKDISNKSYNRTLESERKALLRKNQERELYVHFNWMQERVDKLKFGSRQYHLLASKVDDFILCSEVLGDWCLDFTEGPCRMRRKVWRLYGTHVTFQNKAFSLSSQNLSLTTIGRTSKRDLNDFDKNAKLGENEDDDISKKLDSDFADSDLPVLKMSDPPIVDQDKISKSLKSLQDINAFRSSSHSLHDDDEAITPRDMKKEDEGFEEINKDNTDNNITDETNNAEEDEGEFEEGNVEEEEEGDDASGEKEFESLHGIDEKLRPLLNPGDKIYRIFNCSRILGMDKCDGLLILCEHYIYSIDYLQIKTLPNGQTEVYELQLDVDSNNNLGKYSPSNAAHFVKKSGIKFNSANNKRQSDNDTALTAKKWSYMNVKEIHNRRYLLRHVAMEIFFEDGRNNFFVFITREVRNHVLTKILAISPELSEKLASGGISLSSTPGTDWNKIIRQSKLKIIQEKWSNGYMSNFEYLMNLNTFACRSYNDLTQYPVFPWVLSDYESEVIDLNNPIYFRDLSKPMGTMTEDRMAEFVQRYEVLTESGGSIPPFHYGTHYSSAAIVLHYLVRLLPFTSLHVKLQNGKFDDPDRIFKSIRNAWLNASGKGTIENGGSTTQDVRELIPEFFFLPEFLDNKNNYFFGETQSGVLVNNVDLPPWAKGSTREFIRIHRLALESEYVSSNLHLWIDLIFGYKQTGVEAVNAVNKFYFLTYEGAVDLDDVPNISQREAYIDQIKEFGQTPSQLFTAPHPRRKVITPIIAPPDDDPAATKIKQILSGASNKDYTCVIYENPSKLTANAMSRVAEKINDKIGSVGCIVELGSDRVAVLPSQSLFIPPKNTEFITWRGPDDFVQIQTVGSIHGGSGESKLLSVYESEYTVVCAAALTKDGNTFLSATNDGALHVWHLQKELKGNYKFHLRAVLRAHSNTIEKLCVSQEYSMLISCDSDGVLLMWDLNRLQCIRRILQENLIGLKVVDITINNASGDFSISTTTNIFLCNVNGELLASVDTTKTSVINSTSSTPAFSTDTISAVAIPEFPDWLENKLIFTGYTSGAIGIWQINFTKDESNRKGSWVFNLIRVLRCRMGSVVYMKFSNDLRRMYAGDNQGNVMAFAVLQS